ncbi:fumarate hydratase [Ureibacillus sp. GCM10028918]|uniref:fumarate hydratase n=1 Tax=Ureibacillus sp. GCM10028918 TaxID=3273429 RepID=UPI0036167395
MRLIHYRDIVSKVADMCQAANYDLGEDVIKAFQNAQQTEKSETGKMIINQLLDNAALATKTRVPMCQDTGVAVFIVELGQDCHIVDGSLIDAINEGVAEGYQTGFLRSSIINHPLTRQKTEQYNAPSVVHIEVVPGDQLVLHMSAKGGGAENMSTLKMLKPSDGVDGVKQFILDTVKVAGPNACPPLVVGIGIGGNFERCAYLAKKSLFRPLGVRSQLPDIAQLEEELMQEINRLGIGPQGMGGSTTALDVKIEIEPCHIAALPVAVNLNCHASRHKEAVL